MASWLRSNTLAVGNIGLDDDKTRVYALCFADRHAAGVYPIRGAAGGVVQDVFFEGFAVGEVRPDAGDGFLVGAGSG